MKRFGAEDEPEEKKKTVDFRTIRIAECEFESEPDRICKDKVDGGKVLAGTYFVPLYSASTCASSLIAWAK